MPSLAGARTSTAFRYPTMRLTCARSGLVTAALVLMPALSTAAVCGEAAGAGRSWRVDFAGVRGVRPGMSVREVAGRWGVRFTFSTGSAPGCKIGGVSRGGGVGGGAVLGGGVGGGRFV